MVDDTVYLLKPDYNQINVFQWGNFDYDLCVIKSGVGQQNAELELVVDQEVLDTYNIKQGTTYKVLPENCYTLKNSKLVISEKESSKAFEFVFDSKKILELQDDGNIEFVLPCRIIPLNAISSDQDRMYTIIAPSVKMPYIEFANSSSLNVATIDPTSSNEEKFIANIQTNYNNKWDLTYILGIDPDALIPYNEDRVSKDMKPVELLPADAYTLVEDTWKIPAKANEKDFEYVLHKNKLQGITFDRATWEVIDWSSVRDDDGGGVNTVLDGNLDTYWHSMWEPDASLPHYLVIDMKKERDVMAIELIRRKNNSNTKYVTFELSTDGETFEQVCDMDFGNADNYVSSMEKTIVPKKARYIKCIVHESNNPPHASIAEILVKGID